MTLAFLTVFSYIFNKIQVFRMYSIFDLLLVQDKLTLTKKQQQQLKHFLLEIT